MDSQLTEQEQLFFTRVAMKVASGETIEQGMQSVLADDRRIFETLVTMPALQRQEFDAALSAAATQQVKILYLLSDDGEAQEVRYFCGNTCRQAYALDIFCGRPLANGLLSADDILCGTVCDKCGVQVA